MKSAHKKLLSALHKGITKDPVHAQLISEATKGKPKSEAHKLAMKNRRKADLYLTRQGYFVETPEGDEIFVQVMSEFCREHGLNSGCMSSVLAGKSIQHKGYRARYAGKPRRKQRTRQNSCENYI